MCMAEFTKKEGRSGAAKTKNKVLAPSQWHRRRAGGREVAPLCKSRGFCVTIGGDTEGSPGAELSLLSCPTFRINIRY